MRFLPKACISAFFQPRSIDNSTSAEENTNLRAFGQKERYVMVALAIFTVVVLGVVLVYCFRDGGFHMEYSISRYVGREMWSAGVFLVGNLVIVGLMYEYVMEVWRKYGKLWLTLMAVMMVCFVGLSLCPIGLFDANYGEYGVVSILHQIFSRGMFMTMAVIALVMGVRLFKVGKKMAWVCLAYVGLAIILGVMSVVTKIFWDLNFMLETAYIYLFMIMLML